MTYRLSWTMDRVVLPATALSAALALGVAASNTQLQPIGLSLILLPIFVAFSRFQLFGLAVAFLISDHLVHFLKRAIFLLGPQPQSVYFGIQLLPSLIFMMLCVAAVRQRRRVALPGSAKLLCTFLVIAVATTLYSISHLPLWVVLAAIHQQLLPFLMFFVGLSLTLGQFARIGRVIAVLAAISVLYALLQLASGPTIIDRVWASETYSYSIHGRKVFTYLTGTSPEFRAFSYYADPLTWGLFLVVAFLGATVAREMKEMSRSSCLIVGILGLVGLFFSLTRTSWAGLLVAVGAYFVLRNHFVRRPWLVFCAVAATFAMAVIGGSFLYRELFLARRLPIAENRIAARYLTVGTLEARISAWETLKDTAVRAPFVGRGYGVLHYASRSTEAAQLYRPPFSHNFLVELVFNVGLPGALLFLAFFLQWLREGFYALRNTHDQTRQRVLLWMIAFTVGFVITGYLNGPAFMTYEFFLVMGVLSGYAVLQRHAHSQKREVLASADHGKLGI
jgi:O-antigen ligase